MTTRGRADHLDLGNWNAVCYECGRKRKASYLERNWQGYYVCPEHNEPRQPQDFVRSVEDNQTPPWVQPMPADVFTNTDWLMTEASNATDVTYQVYINTETYYPLETET